MIFHIKKFINKYNWKGINYLSEKKLTGENLRKNNSTIALNVLHSINEKLDPVYVSKQNPKREKHVILLNDFKWRKMALYCSKTKLFLLLRGIMSKYDGDFYCLKCIYSFRTKS